MMTWRDIKRAQEWRNKRTGSHCIVEVPAEHENGFVEVLHSTGRMSNMRTSTLLKYYEPRVTPNASFSRGPSGPSAGSDS